MTYIPYKYGNILYVSGLNGNNVGAIKGDPTRPYKTFSEAMQYAVDGDKVVMVDGDFTITANRWLDFIGEKRTVIFEENTTLTIGDGVYMYSGDEATLYDYTGELEFVCKGKIIKTGTGGAYIPTTYSGTTDFHIKELDGEISSRGPKAKVKIDKINYTNATSDKNYIVEHFFNTSSHPTNPDVPVLVESYIEIDELTIADNTPKIFATLALLSDTLPGSYSYLKVNNTKVGAGETRVGEYRFGTNGGTNTFEGDVTMDLGTITNLSTTGNTTTNFYTAFKNTHAAITLDCVILNGKLTVKTDSLTAPNTAGMGATSLGLDNSYGVINLKNVTSGDYGFNSRLSLTNGSTLIIECDIEVDGDKPALCLVGDVDATSKVIVRGRYVNTGAYPAITIDNSLTGDIQFDNVTYINDGTVAALQTDGPCDVNIVAAATNVLVGTADANINPVGGTILRAATLK